MEKINIVLEEQVYDSLDPPIEKERSFLEDNPFLARVFSSLERASNKTGDLVERVCEKTLDRVCEKAANTDNLEIFILGWSFLTFSVAALGALAYVSGQEYAINYSSVKEHALLAFSIYTPSMIGYSIIENRMKNSSPIFYEAALF